MKEKRPYSLPPLGVTISGRKGCRMETGMVVSFVKACEAKNVAVVGVPEEAEALSREIFEQLKVRTTVNDYGPFHDMILVLWKGHVAKVAMDKIGKHCAVVFIELEKKGEKPDADVKVECTREVRTPSGCLHLRCGTLGLLDSRG